LGNASAIEPYGAGIQYRKNRRVNDEPRLHSARDRLPPAPATSNPRQHLYLHAWPLPAPTALFRSPSKLGVAPACTGERGAIRNWRTSRTIDRATGWKRAGCCRCNRYVDGLRHWLRRTGMPAVGQYRAVGCSGRDSEPKVTGKPADGRTLRLLFWNCQCEMSWPSLNVVPAGTPETITLSVSEPSVSVRPRTDAERQCSVLRGV
jgi:hypothetical protein